MSSNKRLRLSDPSSITPGASTSSSYIPKSYKYDVFLSFRGEDTRKNFVGHLYEALRRNCIEAYKDDEKITKGERINDQLLKSIEDSKFYIIVFSKNYASSSWCLDELVKIIECQKMTDHTAFPVFYDVEPTEVRKQYGPVGEAFSKHENQEAAGKWRDAMKELANLAGWELKATANGDESKSIQIIVDAIFKKLHSTNSSTNHGKLVGMETRISDVLSSLEIGTEDVRMIGIKGMGGAGKTTLARAVYDQISYHFEGKSFVENVREISKPSLSGLKELQKQILEDVLNTIGITFSSVHDGKNMLKATMRRRKILVVLDDVDHIEQLEALGEHDWFKSGSRIIITTRDEQVLLAHGANFVHDVKLLSHEEASCLFSRYAFKREIPTRGYEELSGQVVQYADGLPLTIKVLGSFLCGKDKLEWVDAIKRLKKIPLKDTLEKLELSYISLEDEYKEIFLDIACILKGIPKEDAIIILECCGFHARIGLKVLEQRSLISISYKYGQLVLGMHDHIEEMGKNIVRREYPDEPNKHSRLWIDEEIEDILTNDMGTEATTCLKLYTPRVNARIGLEKMKKLRYLKTNFANFDYRKIDGDDLKLDEATRCFTNSLKFLTCLNYPFLYLPRTFQANNLVGLDMYDSRRMVQLWEEGEKKVLKKLKLLSLFGSNLTTYDFTITPNLEMLSLYDCFDLKELCMPATCQKLNYLNISRSKLITFDLGLTPNLETLIIFGCTHFVKLQVPVACPNLKTLDLGSSRLRSLDLELVPNLERLDLTGCSELVEINAPVGCLKNVVYLNLSGCLRFTHFVFGGSEEKVSRSLATLYLAGESLDVCPLHPNSSLPKLRFICYYEEDLPSSVGNFEKLISVGLCACTDLKKFSDVICSLRCLRELKLECNIPEFSEDLIKLECLEKLKLSSKKIEYLPDSICLLKHLKSLDVGECCRLGKLPEDIGQLESLETLDLSATMIKHLPDSICMLKHLKHLNLGDCALLEKLSEDLGRLECLEELNIVDSGISHLPQSIFGLKGLLIAASPELLHLYDFPSEIETTTSYRE
ncbi:disease resistance TIR-NBS-LRR class family protein, partial [Tanacetum coccineum]